MSATSGGDDGGSVDRGTLTSTLSLPTSSFRSSCTVNVVLSPCVYRILCVTVKLNVEKSSESEKLVLPMRRGRSCFTVGSILLCHISTSLSPSLIPFLSVSFCRFLLLFRFPLSAYVECSLHLSCIQRIWSTDCRYGGTMASARTCGSVLLALNKNTSY